MSISLVVLFLLGNCLNCLTAEWPLVAEQPGWHVRNLSLKGEQLGAEQGARGSGRLKAPVLSERLLCRAEQVSAKQLSPSLEADTLLNYTNLSTGTPSMLRSMPSCPSAFPLPSCQESSTFLSSAWLFTTVVLLTKQLNDSVKYTNPFVLCLAAHSHICQHSANALNPSSSLGTSQLLILWKGRAGSHSVRCMSRWIIQSAHRTSVCAFLYSQITNHGKMARDRLTVVMDWQVWHLTFNLKSFGN